MSQTEYLETLYNLCFPYINHSTLLCVRYGQCQNKSIVNIEGFFFMGLKGYSYDPSINGFFKIKDSFNGAQLIEPVAQNH